MLAKRRTRKTANLRIFWRRKEIKREAYLNMRRKGDRNVTQVGNNIL